MKPAMVEAENAGDLAGAKRKSVFIDDDDEDEEGERAAKKVLTTVPSFEVVVEKKPSTAKKTGTGRPRGRPRKDAATKPAPEAQMVTDPATGSSPTNTDTEPQPIPVKKRGRPPKIKRNVSNPLEHAKILSNPSPLQHESSSGTQGLFSMKQEGKGCTKTATASPSLFSMQNQGKERTNSAAEPQTLFTKTKQGYEFMKTVIAPPALASATVDSPKVVRGTFIQDSQGHFTPAPGYEPPVDVQMKIGRQAYIEDEDEAAKSIFAPKNANKTPNGDGLLFGGGNSGSRGGGTDGRVFGGKNTSSGLFGAPAPDTFASLFGGPGAVPNNQPRVGSLHGSTGPASISGPTRGSCGFGNIFGGQGGPLMVSNSRAKNLFGSCTGCSPSPVGATGTLFTARPGSGGNASVGESGKADGSWTPVARSIFGGNAVSHRDEGAFTRESKAKWAAEQQRT